MSNDMLLVCCQC